MPRNKNPVKMGIVWGNALTRAFFNICVVFPIFSSFLLSSSPTPVWCNGCHKLKATHSLALSDTFPVKSKTEDPHHAFRFIPSALYKMDVFRLQRIPQTTRAYSLPYSFVTARISSANASVQASPCIRHSQLPPSVDGIFILASPPSPR